MGRKGSKKFAIKMVMLLAGIMAMGIFVMTSMADIHAKDGSIPVDKVHFPDGTFRSYVKKEIAKGKDVLTQADCDAVISVKIGGDYKDIKSLEGIQYFTKLDMLSCSYIELTEIDLQKCPELTFLFLNYCQLKSLSLP